MKRLLLSILPLLVAFAHPAKEVPFTVENYQNLANYFDTKKDMLDFFELKKGDQVADIGAGDGKMAAALSLESSGVTFYLEDIDDKVLDQKSFNKIVNHYSTLKGYRLSNEFILTIGNEKETTLPHDHFNKILIISAYHEFEYADAMVKDIDSKLKSKGRIYILETHCYTKKHKNVSFDEVQVMMQKYGYTLIKNQSPKAPETWCAVFEKK